MIVVLVMMYNPFMDKIREGRGIRENHCLEEESYYYRIEQGLLFNSRVETSEEKADDIDYRCIEWEEEIIVGKAFLGQKLIYEKGSLNS